MKTLVHLFSLFALCCLMIVGRAEAQLFETSPYAGLYFSNCTSADNWGNRWALGGSKFFCKRLVVLEIDSTGAFAFEHVLTGPNQDWGYGDVMDVQATTDGNLVGTGWARQGDDVGVDRGILFKIGPGGTPLWSKDFRSFFILEGVEELVDSSLIAWWGVDLIHTDMDGDSLKQFSLNLGSINACAGLLANDFVVATDLGAIVGDTTGASLTSKLFPTAPCQDVDVLPNGEIILTCGGMIYQLDPSLNVLDSLDLSVGYNEFTSIDVSGNEIWAMGVTTTTNQWGIEKIQVPLLPASITALVSDDTLAPADVVAGDSEVLIAGIEPTGKTQSTFIKNFDKANLNGLAAETDAAVVGLQLTGFFPTANGAEVEMQVLVENRGTATLNQVYVSTLGDGGFNCAIPSYHELFTGLSIAPGQSAWLSYPRVQINVGPVMPGTREFCFWTAHPNGRLDKDHRNDLFCDTLPLVVGIEEALTLPQLRLFPQPAGEKFVLEIQDENRWSVVLYDLQGRALGEWKTIPGEQLEIPRQGRSSGLYMLELQANESRIVKKVWFR